MLSGVAAVGIRSVGEYVSQDLDMVNCHLKKRSAIRKYMGGIGFIEETRYFKHDKKKHHTDMCRNPKKGGTILFTLLRQWIISNLSVP